jgi:predicted dehydrogenase/nucleoside-diphosphate-sugar epimerase
MLEDDRCRSWRAATPPPRPPIRICTVGGGAHAEQAYLPTLSRMPDYRVESLVDIDLDRRRYLAQRYKIPHHSASVDDIPATVEAAVVALPHDLHRPISCELLTRGIHVLCEKPMATTLADAEAMVRCAREHAAHLHVGNIYRHYWTSTRVKELLESERLGRLVSFRIEVGYVHNWPTTSGFFFDKHRSGGGVLIDMGAHVIDLLLWWLGDYPTTVMYRDDDFGGVEAECHLALEFRGSVRGTVRLSRLMSLENVYELTCEQGTVSFRPYDSSGVCNTIRIDRRGRITTLKAEHCLRWGDYCERQLRAFFDAVREGRSGTEQAESVIPSIRLIEECYRTALRLEAPSPKGPRSVASGAASAPRALELARARVLVTGASGFIGSRVAERLYFDFGNRARCLSRSFSKLARLSRLPVEHVIGDVLDPHAVRAAVAGCDVVVHCAYGTTGDQALDHRINVAGTENVVTASIAAGVKRFVYLSSVEVYGQNQPPIVDETTPTSPSRYDYGNSKLEAEQVCATHHARAGLPTVILRLAVVYGPHSPIWTIAVVNRLRNRGFVLCDRFDGVCNPVYVDDCVDAVFLVVARADAVGETFIISGGERLTWNDYFKGYNEMLGLPPLERATSGQVRAYWLLRRLFDAVFNRIGPRSRSDMLFTYGHLRERGRLPNLKAVLQRGSLLVSEDIFARPAYYSIEKARRQLGFEPRHDFSRGLGLVKAWLDGASRASP